MEKFDKETMHKDLYACLSEITSPDVMKNLLQDLCTYTEVEQMAQRLMCAKLLLKGYTYNQIIEATDISSATLSRVSRCIQHGSGGYADAIGNAEKTKK